MEGSTKTVVITGSERGIGYGLAEYFCKNKTTTWNVIMACKNKEQALKAKESLMSKYPTSKFCVEDLDISDSSSITNFVKCVETKCKQGIDILINNAGVFLKTEFSEECIDKCMKVNFWGTVRFT
jgi:NAD(P)-dependent dehydrogenase (short-subunit alcohol dehydrogenase family)